ncbi:ABC-2 family transporter protein [compost metagenome]
MNEFDGYVPGLIALAVLMILFTASASIVKENDQKTLLRLKLSRLGAFNFLAGICITQAIVAAGALALSYWTALGLGYRPAGEFGAVFAVGLLSSFSMVAVSLVVASFLNTVFDVLTIGCFPFFILMFFSGSMFPLPKMNVFTIGGHSFGITDLLPLTHTANAFNQILNYGAGLEDVLFDFVMIALLTVIYFAMGLRLYQQRKLSKA